MGIEWALCAASVGGSSALSFGWICSVSFKASFGRGVKSLHPWVIYGEDKSMFPLPAWIDEEVWKGFEAMRRAKGKSRPFTERAAKMILAECYKLRDLGHDPNAALDQSTLNGWSDIYAPVAKEIPKAAKPSVDKTSAYLQDLEAHARLVESQRGNREPIKLVRRA